MKVFKVSYESALELADLFVSTGFYHEWTYTWREPMTVAYQYDGLVDALKEIGGDTIFVLHEEDGRFSWRTFGDEFSFSEIDFSDNSGSFNMEQVAVIEQFLVLNCELGELDGIDFIYAKFC
jgi:hypothetical protein